MVIHSRALSRRLRRHSREIRDLVAAADGSNIRLPSSVARGEDHPDSDVDLLFTMGAPLSLMQLGRLERAVSDLVQADVDLIPDSATRPELRPDILEEAIPL